MRSKCKQAVRSLLMACQVDAALEEELLQPSRAVKWWFVVAGGVPGVLIPDSPATVLVTCNVVLFISGSSL